MADTANNHDRASVYAQARIGHLAELYAREGRARTPEESAEMLALMRAQRERARQMNALADQYGWDVDMVSKLVAEPAGCAWEGRRA